MRRRPFKLDGPSARPIPPDDLRGRGWVERPPQDPPPGVGNFESVFRSFPAIQTELAQVLSEAKQQGLKAAFKTAANRCGRFGGLLVNEGLAVLEAGSQNLEAANLPPFPLDLAWAELPE